MTIEPLHDPKVAELSDAVAARAHAGEIIALAVVEVRRNGDVAAQAEGGGRYHELHSGLQRLAARLAMQDD